jgi:tetratricopeptide (TPR) repeat protein
MNKRATVTALLLGSLTCGSEAGLAKADRLHDAGRVTSNPTPQVWQTSYAAEAAGNFEAALNALNELPASRSSGYMASFRRGWLQYRLGRFADSVASYTAAIALEPMSIEARVAQLASLAAEAKWPEVIAGAEEVLKRDPGNYLAAQRLAFAKFSTQRFPEAEQLYRRLVQMYPSDVETRASLGWAVLRMGKQKEAAALFTQVLELSPNHAVAKSGLEEATSPKKANSF